MIAIIDYDMGNLRSVEKAFERIGAEAVITRDAKVIDDAKRVVLPGVGAFKDCMHNLTEYGLVEPVLRAIDSGRPFLGICVGMQLLFEEGHEFGRHRGLGVFKGTVERFPAEIDQKVPHMCWNTIKIKKDSALLEGIEDETFFYFVHSYYVKPVDEAIVLTKTEYGVDFTSSVSSGNVYGCQFHPEKSQKAGLAVLKNFSELK